MPFIDPKISDDSPPLPGMLSLSEEHLPARACSDLEPLTDLISTVHVLKKGHDPTHSRCDGGGETGCVIVGDELAQPVMDYVLVPWLKLARAANSVKRHYTTIAAKFVTPVRVPWFETHFRAMEWE